MLGERCVEPHRRIAVCHTTSDRLSSCRHVNDGHRRARPNPAKPKYVCPELAVQRRVPRPELRVEEGDVLETTVRNEVSEETTTHWHGVPVPNAMDGVPDITQQPIAPGEWLFYCHNRYHLEAGMARVIRYVQ